jgi:regulator of protease activity HflC (stomatin/prohibitin superfamily)
MAAEIHIPHRVVYGVIGLIILVVVASFAFGSFVTVPAGYKGVLLTWGAPSGEFDPGLHFKLPVAQSVAIVSLQVLKAENQESAASSDLQDVSTTVALNYQVDPNYVAYIYTNFRDTNGAQSGVIAPAVQESVKAVTAKFTASDLIDKREDVRVGIQTLLSEKLNQFHILVTAVSITNFEFSPSFTAAIEAKVTQQQKALEAQNKLLQIQYEAQQQVIQAQAARNATIVTAEGAARARVIAAQAEANATIAVAQATAEQVKLINDQLNAAPNYLQYIYLKQWNGVLPTTILGSNTTVLFGLPGAK